MAEERSRNKKSPAEWSGFVLLFRSRCLLLRGLLPLPSSRYCADAAEAAPDGEGRGFGDRRVWGFAPFNNAKGLEVIDIVYVCMV